VINSLMDGKLILRSWCRRRADGDSANAANGGQAEASVAECEAQKT